MKLKRSLAYQLLKITFSIYLTITIVITASHMYTAWIQAEYFLQEDLQQLGVSTKQGIILALWDLDYVQVDLIVEGLLLLPFVVGIEVKDREIDKLYGVRGNIKRQYELIHEEEEEVFYDIGKMTLYSSRNIVFDRVRNGYILTIINAAIKIIALWIIVLWIGRKLITKPLTALAEANASIDLENIKTFKEIKVAPYQRGSEIETLTDSFNKMIRRLTIDHRELDRIQKNLEFEIARQTQELQQANTKLIELDEFKQGMTSMLVHDLKNQLSIILSQVEKKESKRAAEHMLNMVMNILDVQKFEEAKMTLDIKDHSLFSVAESAIQQIEFLSHQKSIIIDNTISPQIVTTFDIEIIKRVFVNLLTNGIKYTPNHGKIKLFDDKSQTGIIRIGVSDTGEGIPADKFEQIFDKFVQVKAKNLGDIRSTGLGLAFCKLAIEAHNGQINVESELNKGTIFWLTLPWDNKYAQSNNLENLDNGHQESSAELALSDDEKALLKPYISALEDVMVYETSEVKNILKNIEIDNNNINQWKQEIQKTLYTLQEERYNKLLELVK